MRATLALRATLLLHRSFEHKGLLVFGVDSESPEIAREYLDKFAYTLPSLIDTKEDVANLYHVQGWPTTVLIDSEGKVAFYEVGFSAEPLRNALTTIGVWQAQ